MSDINKSKEFHEWIRKTFYYIDNDLKKFMFRAWCKALKVNRTK